MSLLTQLQEGEKEAYYELFRTHHDQVFRFIAKYTENFERAKELTYTVFLTIWENRASLSTTTAFSEQVYEIARDMIIDEYRQDFDQRKKSLFRFNDQLKSRNN